MSHATASRPVVSGLRFCPRCDANFDAARTRCPNDGSILLWQRRGPELIGRTLANRFVVLSELGRGGMGAVYVARQSSVGREVALKVMQRDGDLDAARRFVREARLVASLAHPNIVSVIDFGQDDDGLLFIAMERLHGLGLDALMEDEGRLPWPRAVRIAIQTCDALAFAHQRGVIHRDLKPQNVIVVDPHPERDTLKVLDFGLAKSLDPDQSTLTREGVIFGTPAYLSPEMIEGRAVGPGADLYALGIMLFEMLEGRVPFDGDSLHEIAMKHLSEPPPPLTSEVPATLGTIVRRLLAKDPTDRFKSAAALREALLSIDSAPSVSAPSVDARFIAPSRSVSARFIAPIAFILSVSALLILWHLTRDHEPTPPTDTATTLTTSSPPVSPAAQPTSPAPTPLASLPDVGSTAEADTTTSAELTPDTRLHPTPDTLPPPSTEVVWVLEGTVRARVTLDGEPVGTTPLTLRLEPRPRQRTLRFTRPGHYPAVRVLPGDQDASLRVVLTPEESFIVPEP